MVRNRSLQTSQKFLAHKIKSWFTVSFKAYYVLTKTKCKIILVDGIKHIFFPSFYLVLDMIYFDSLWAHAPFRTFKINTAIHVSKIIRINLKHQPIKLNNMKLVHLGATVSKQGGGMEDLRRRVSKARSAFTRLKRIWNSHFTSKKTKLGLHKTLVIPVLTY